MNKERPKEMAAIVNSTRNSANRDVPYNALFFVVVASIISLGTIFRTQGYFDGNISFWLDEAMWANRLIVDPLMSMVKIRPIGFMCLTKMLVQIRQDEIFFRMVSYLASIVSLPLVYLIAKRLYRSKLSIILALFVFSFNPILITFAKEFKPYALELMIHLIFVYLLLRHRDNREIKIFYFIIGYAFFSVVFAYNAVFFLPALFALLLSDVIKIKDGRRLKMLVAVFCVFLLVTVIFALFVAPGWNIEDRRTFWGEKYDVFYLGTSLVEYGGWVITKYAGLVQSSGSLKVFWTDSPEIKIGIGWMLITVHMIGGIGLLVDRRFHNFILLLLPVGTVTVMNFIGLWPFGPFRVGIFLFSYFLLITCYGFDYLVMQKTKLVRYLSTCLVIVSFFVIQFPLGMNYYRTKTSKTWAYQFNVPKILKAISNEEQNALGVEPEYPHGKRLLMDLHAYYPIDFYLRHHADAEAYRLLLKPHQIRYRVISGNILQGNLDGLTTQLNRLSNDPDVSDKVWLVLDNPLVLKKIGGYLKQQGMEVLYQSQFPDNTLVLMIYNAKQSS